jgi:alpha-L-arabinofuranosidase
VNLINFDASRSFARISYYAIQLFNQNRADTNLATTVQIAAPAITTNHFTGGIGLGTWDTQTEYKDITVTQHGKVAYASDFVNNPGEWALLRGQWQVHDSALLQSAPGAQHLAVLNNKTFDTYTLTLKARKKEGYNAFIIPFGVKDSNTFLRAHIGSWVNSHCVFEKVTGGYDVSALTDQVRLKHPIESNRWYTIRLEVLADSIACYLDDTLLMTYKEPATLFSIAGKSATGDIIVKMVNSGSTPVVTTLDITPSNHIGHDAVLQTLAAASEEAENSFEHPREYVPVKTIISHTSNHFALTLKPYSINVLRLQDN